MTDLTAVIHDLVARFDRLRLPNAIMGGIAVRAHGLPRPTFDVDFVLAVPGQPVETSMRRWAGPLGVAGQLEQARAALPRPTPRCPEAAYGLAGLAAPPERPAPRGAGGRFPPGTVPPGHRDATDPRRRSSVQA